MPNTERHTASRQYARRSCARSGSVDHTSTRAVVTAAALARCCSGVVALTAKSSALLPKNVGTAKRSVADLDGSLRTRITRCSQFFVRSNLMAITASFIPGTGQLTEFGDSLDNTIVTSRNAA